MTLRPIQAAEEAAEAIEDTVRGKLVSWLDHHTCDCGAVCEADTQFVERQAMVMDIWVCPDCERRYHRDSDVDKLTANMWD